VCVLLYENIRREGDLPRRAVVVAWHRHGSERGTNEARFVFVAFLPAAFVTLLLIRPTSLHHTAPTPTCMTT
jgi:hypothetical protein